MLVLQSPPFLQFINTKISIYLRAFSHFRNAKSDEAPMEISASPTSHGDRQPSVSSSSALAPIRSRRRAGQERERVRVSRACDRCKSKKTRCTGKCPCTLCTRAGLPCEYNALYSRGQQPLIVIDESAAALTRRRNPSSQHLLDQVSQTSQVEFHLDAVGHSLQSPIGVADHAEDHVEHEPIDHLAYPNNSSLDATGKISSRASPDLQAHYVGPSSGVSFLSRIQKRLHQTISFTHSSSIFAFGDAPLPEFDPTFFFLPPKSDAEELIARYFDFGVPTHRFLHRPTIETWLNEFYETKGAMENKKDAPGQSALLLMVMAQATDFMPNSNTRDSADISARYFLAADHRLSKECGEVRLTSVQARLCQCFYLLSQSRINHCWSLFGTTAHLALSIGLNRHRRWGSKHNLIELECCRRVFWCAYSLDNYLSASLGRPRTFKDEDIDQKFPICVNDSCIFPNRIEQSSKNAQSIMLGPVAHIKLSRIVSLVLRDLYPISPVSQSDCTRLAAQYSSALWAWRADLSRFLDPEGVDPSMLLPLFQRQRNVLNVSFWHALILVHRPFLLSNFASLKRFNNTSRPETSTDIETKKNVAECLKAAMSIVSIVDELVQGKQMFRAFWFTAYFSFCAVVVLYVYCIQQRFCPPETYQTYFDAAVKCQNQIYGVASKQSLHQRYYVVLEELRCEAIKHTQNRPSLGPPERSVSQHNAQNIALGAIQQQNNIPDQTSFDPQIDVELGYPNDTQMMTDEMMVGASPSSLLAEMTSWGEFDSLVTGGAGPDMLFNGDMASSWGVLPSDSFEALM